MDSKKDKRDGSIFSAKRDIPVLRIVICGSMTFYHQMKDIQLQMNELGVKSVIPDGEEGLPVGYTNEQLHAVKRELSRAHLQRIKSPETFAILAVNLDKHGIQDYVGANTFAEIAVAFAHKKRIYLMQGIPAMYADEIKAWRGVPLWGHMTELISDYRKTCHRETNQGLLFD